MPGKLSGRPAMDPASEIKQLRQLCTLLRAELAAQCSEVTSRLPTPFLCMCRFFDVLSASMLYRGWTCCRISASCKQHTESSGVSAIVRVACLTMPCHAQGGTPGPATPGFHKDTELRIEAIVKERVGAELVEVMFKARQHGRQQVCYACRLQWLQRHKRKLAPGDC